MMMRFFAVAHNDIYLKILEEMFSNEKQNLPYETSKM